MVFGFGDARGRASARNSRLFREARRRLGLEIVAITNRNAAKGLLKSGGTIKEIVRAFDETTLVAVRAGLDGIATITEHAHSKRKGLLSQLQASLADHHAEAVNIAQQAIERIGLGNDFRHAVPLFEQAQLRHREMIDDCGEGWTAPAGKPWKDEHPFQFMILSALVGGAIALGLKSAADRLWPVPSAEKSATGPTVATDVARNPTQTRSPDRRAAVRNSAVTH